jgi:hypothetical protein
MIAIFSNSVQVINCTPHEIRFLDGGKIVEVPPSGVLLNAQVIEEKVSDILVHTKFIGDENGRREIERIQSEFPNTLIVGSVISAQAYKGLVVGMTPAKGFERVAPAEKLMATDKFSIF